MSCEVGYVVCACLSPFLPALLPLSLASSLSPSSLLASLLPSLSPWHRPHISPRQVGAAVCPHVASKQFQHENKYSRPSKMLDMVAARRREFSTTVDYKREREREKE